MGEAAEQLTKAIQLAPKADPSLPIPKLRAILARCYFEENELDKAFENAQMAIEGFEKSGNTKDPNLFSALSIAGDVYSRKDKLSEAVGVYDKLYQTADARKLVSPVEYAQATILLGDIYRRQNKLTEADRLYKLGLDSAQNYLTNPGPFLPKAKYGYGLVLEQEGKYKEAEDSFREALPLVKAAPPPAGGDKSALYGAIKKQISECMWKTNWVGALTSRFSDNNK